MFVQGQHGGPAGPGSRLSAEVDSSQLRGSRIRSGATQTLQKGEEQGGFYLEKGSFKLMLRFTLSFT